MNNLVEKALNSLNTLNKSSLHPTDEDRIKVTLKALHKNEVEINLNELESWLIENNWQKKPIKSIVTWAEAITSGGRVQIKHKQMAPTEKEVWERINA